MAARRRQAPEPHWEVDRKIPAALIFAMLVQFSGLVWWMSGLQASVTRTREDLIELTLEVKARTTKMEKLIQFDRDLAHVGQSVNRLENEFRSWKQYAYRKNKDR